MNYGYQRLLLHLTIKNWYYKPQPKDKTEWDTKSEVLRGTLKEREVEDMSIVCVE